MSGATGGAKQDDPVEREALQAALAQGLRPDDLEHVVPVIEPRAWVERVDWPGPYVRLRHPALAMTWAVLHPGQVMVYVTHARVAAWEREGVEWRARARANLVARSPVRLWTHEKVDDAGILSFVAMSHDDGLGASRALLTPELSISLGPNLFIGVPDRSCGIVFPTAAASVGAAHSPAEWVAEMYERATSPLCPALLTPSDLEIDGSGAG